MKGEMRKEEFKNGILSVKCFVERKMECFYDAKFIFCQLAFNCHFLYKNARVRHKFLVYLIQ